MSRNQNQNTDCKTVLTWKVTISSIICRAITGFEEMLISNCSCKVSYNFHALRFERTPYDRGHSTTVSLEANYFIQL